MDYSDDDDGTESCTTNTSLVGKKSKSHLTLRKLGDIILTNVIICHKTE